MKIRLLKNCLRECAAEQRTSSWIRARVAKGLPTAPLRQFGRARSCKFAEFPDRTFYLSCFAGNSSPWRPNLVPLWAESSFLGPQKTPSGTRDFLFFRLAGCGLRIAFVKTGKSYSVNEEPSATYSYSVNVHVATQLCADPTLPSVFGSGKSSKSSYSKTLYSASRRRGIRYKLFGVNFGSPSPPNSGV